MKNTFRNILLALILVTGVSSFGYSQSSYEIDDLDGIDVVVKGTSSVRDWEMDATVGYGEANFIFKSDSVLTSLDSLNFYIEVKDLKSGSKKLNKHAHEALNSDDYKVINYKLFSSTLTPDSLGYLLKTVGKLTISGVTKDIEMDVYSVLNDNGSITCKGSYNLIMSDYDVDPPSLMWGAIKTHDAVILDFEVVYKKQADA